MIPPGRCQIGANKYSNSDEKHKERKTWKDHVFFKKKISSLSGTYNPFLSPYTRFSLLDHGRDNCAVKGMKHSQRTMTATKE
jgi:hypothetical protein